MAQAYYLDGDRILYLFLLRDTAQQNQKEYADVKERRNGVKVVLPPNPPEGGLNNSILETPHLGGKGGRTC